MAAARSLRGAERLARVLAHTEREISYYLERLDSIDEQVERGFSDKPAHRDAFRGAVAALQRRRERLAKRQIDLEKREEKVLVFGEPDSKPMGYARAPKVPSYNLQSVVDVESGLIIHDDVFNDANDSRLLYPMSTGARHVLDSDELHVLADGGYSNAEEVARCERDAITVSAPIKRGAMNSEHFRPPQFVYDEAADTICCPAGETLRPPGSTPAIERSDTERPRARRVL